MERAWKKLPPMIHITEIAAKQMLALAGERGMAEAGGLRLSIEKGGCAGLQYEMGISERHEGDEVFEQHGGRLFIPGVDLPNLKGSTIDYEDGLNGAGFRILNPNATRSCGCGTSFEPAGQSAA